MFPGTGNAATVTRKTAHLRPFAGAECIPLRYFFIASLSSDSRIHAIDVASSMSSLCGIRLFLLVWF